MKKVICLAAAIAAASISQSALAQSNQNAIYGGVGTSIQAKNADTSDKTPFKIGKADIYREGKDVCIIACASSRPLGQVTEYKS